MARNRLNRAFSLLRGKKVYLLIAALGPGWIIPRILGTIAFLAHPTIPGLIGLLSWWLVVPALWIVAIRILRRLKRRYSCLPQP